MSLLEKIQRYRLALQIWRKHNTYPPIPEPTPEEYGLKSASDKWMARKIRDEQDKPS